jgi:hypothetical protein
VVADLLADAVEEAGDDPRALEVLDLGAGNGMVGEALREHGFREITGDRTGDDSGFAGLIAGMLRDGAIDERGRRRSEHRLDVAGEPIHYVAIAGVKPAR